jgi:CheY-like chemotaxis protein
MIASVLIVDDTAECRRQTRRCLVALGFAPEAVREAEHGAQALELLREQGADLIITDLDMPVMGGFQLMHAIDRNPRFAALARVVVTATTSLALTAMLNHLKVAAVLRKPLDGAELARVLAGLGGAPAHSEPERSTP